MYIDAENEFSDTQVVTATAVGTNVFDAKVVADLGRGEPVPFEFAVDTVVQAAGAATVDFQIVDDDNEALASPTVLASSGPIAKATLVAGYKIRLMLSPDTHTQRYIGVQYTVATGPLTSSSAFSAYISPVAQAADTYVGQ